MSYLLAFPDLAQKEKAVKTGIHSSDSDCFESVMSVWWYVSEDFKKKHFPVGVNITHWSTHFMCPLTYLAHKSYSRYFFQVVKTHFQFSRSLCSVCSLHQDNGRPRWWQQTTQAQWCKPCRLRANCSASHIGNYTLLQSLHSFSFTGLPVCYRAKSYWTAATHSENCGWLWFNLGAHKGNITDILKGTDVQLLNNSVFSYLGS